MGGGAHEVSARRTAWRRFRANRAAKAGGALLAAITLVSLLALPFSVRWYNVQSLESAVRHAPSLRPVVGRDVFGRAMDTAADAERRGALLSAAHGVSSWLGHDDLGRSLLYRLMAGLLISLMIGLAAGMVAVLISVPWGALAALAGGRVDTVMMRIVDVLYSLPYILMVILLRMALTRPLTALFGERSAYANIAVLLLAIGGVSWLTMARIVRGQVLSLRAQPFVEAARAAGAGRLRLLVRHMVPNLVGPVAVYATLVVPQAILQESFLSFLGLGVQQPVPSLGRLAADGVEAVNTFVGYWWLLVFPCGLLVVTLLALNFLGDGLRDAVDPKGAQPSLV